MFQSRNYTLIKYQNRIFQMQFQSFTIQDEKILQIKQKDICFVFQTELDFVFSSYTISGNIEEQDQMRPLKFQAEFKDNFFINQLTLTHTTSSLHKNESKVTLSRSMWTNKIKRKKIIVQKNASNDKIFRKAFFEKKNQQQQNTKGSVINRPCSLTYHQPNEFISRKVVSWSSTQRNNIKPDSHFIASRNFSHQLGDNIHEKTTILQQRIQTQIEKQNIRRSGDPRYFLKNLNIKSNINIYKGNFSKFTKKIVNKSQLKKKNITSDSSVSPWQITEKPSHYCL